MKIDNTIDFLVTWVDDTDREWRKSKNYHLNKLHNKENQNNGSIDIDDIRYRDWDLLKYWFRAVEKYAPWVNKVHFVTCGHVPEWLNLDCPKLNFVKHSDFIPEKYLPTFSSHPIELNFHRIEGLSEQFVYFNDDFYLTAPVKKEDFFVKGLPCDNLVENLIEFKRREIYNIIRMNDIIFANQHFKRKEVNRRLRRKRFSLNSPGDALKNMIFSIFKKNTYFGLEIHHLPQAYLKQTLKEVWEADQDLLDETSSHKFRDERDVSQCVFKYWQLMTGNYHPYNKRKNGRLYMIGSDTEALCQAVRNRSYKYVCLNDSDVIDFEKTKSVVNQMFEEVFPEKSSFEL